jgi:hypothetical protein
LFLTIRLIDNLIKEENDCFNYVKQKTGLELGLMLAKQVLYHLRQDPGPGKKNIYLGSKVGLLMFYSLTFQCCSFLNYINRYLFFKILLSIYLFTGFHYAAQGGLELFFCSTGA